MLVQSASSADELPENIAACNEFKAGIVLRKIQRSNPIWGTWHNGKALDDVHRVYSLVPYTYGGW